MSEIVAQLGDGAPGRHAVTQVLQSLLATGDVVQTVKGAGRRASMYRAGSGELDA